MLIRCKATVPFLKVDNTGNLCFDADDALFETVMTNSVHILQPYLPERHELTISGIVPTIGVL